MTNWTTEFSRLGQAVVNKVRLGTAVDSPLVLSVFICFGGMTAYVITREIFLLYIAAAPVTIFCLGFVYFMLKDPNKLRSEEHEQTIVRLGVGLGQSGKPEVSEERLDELSPTKNPALNELTQGGKKK